MQRQNCNFKFSSATIMIAYELWTEHVPEQLVSNENYIVVVGTNIQI